MQAGSLTFSRVEQQGSGEPIIPEFGYVIPRADPVQPLRGGVAGMACQKRPHSCASHRAKGDGCENALPPPTRNIARFGGATRDNVVLGNQRFERQIAARRKRQLTKGEAGRPKSRQKPSRPAPPS